MRRWERVLSRDEKRKRNMNSRQVFEDDYVRKEKILSV
jgi:hypothetical protein